ncbi:MAG: NAD(P)/FAD-dependent oxidoreductase [Acidimicrobiales bacterium]
MGGNDCFVIVGASLAGAKAAETLRVEGFDGRIVLVGDEEARPYERPPLSKGYLRGEQGFDDAAVHVSGYYADNDIELRTSTAVSSIDPVASRVTLDSSEELSYDKLLLATGAAPRRLKVPGSELGGILYLRSVGDSDALREAIKVSGRVVVIGAGWIGSEVAASARQLGADVALVELDSVPLQRVLGPKVGAVYRDLHAAQGVELHFGVGLESLEGSTGVERVLLTDGTAIEADLVVVGIGVAPRAELAEAAALEVSNGVVTDEHLASSAPAIYAAGDVANAYHPRYGARIRLEHWSSALNQGPVAAKNMLGHVTPYEKLPYFFSDQYDLGMEYRGYATGSDEVVFRGDPTGGEFIAFWLRDDRVLAAMNANIWDAGDAIEGLLSAGRVVDPARLADPDESLAELASSEASKS